MSVSNSSARVFSGLKGATCETGAVYHINGASRDVRTVGVIDDLRRAHVKRVTHGSKKYARVMAQHQKILLARKEGEK